MQDNRFGTGNADLRLTVNAIVDLSENIRGKFEYQHKRQFDAQSSLNDIPFDLRYRLEKNRDIRFSYHFAGSGQFSLLLGHYW